MGSPDEGYVNLVHIRGEAIKDIASVLMDAAINPDLQKEQVERLIAGARPIIDAWDLSVRAAHTSSHSDYARRDAPIEQQEAYARALHAIRIMEALHGI